MLHFGYGSNLSIKAVHEDLNPNAKYVMKGFLPNFEVAWPMPSGETEGAAYSGIMEAPGDMVHGALYEMTEQELIAMDNLEDCYKDTYKRETFLVLGEDGKWHEADLYRVVDPQGPFAPERSYVEIMLEGARDLKIDPEYIKKIEGFLSRSK
jgi:gamma-glutamylcyclotransferase (GGCT)/AIG2-like uncharacterized protein YtfP